MKVFRFLESRVHALFITFPCFLQLFLYFCSPVHPDCTRVAPDFVIIIVFAFEQKNKKEREGLKFQVCVPKVIVKTLVTAPESI